VLEKTQIYLLCISGRKGEYTGWGGQTIRKKERRNLTNAIPSLGESPTMIPQKKARKKGGRTTRN